MFTLDDKDGILHEHEHGKNTQFMFMLTLTIRIGLSLGRNDPHRNTPIEFNGPNIITTGNTGLDSFKRYF